LTSLKKRKQPGSYCALSAPLPLRQQEVIQLKFQNDLSYQQIAEIMQTTANNVGVLLHTALKTLRQRYGQVAADFIPFKPKPNE
jgi:RNA polymerase sigma-70 factor (ECF subfamily)